MRRLSILFFVACSFTLTAFAHEISAEQSLRKAVATISDKSYAKPVRGKADFALVHTQKSPQNGKALYYVFGNAKNGGFVITGADHRANSVLGYTENGTFEQALAIPAFRSWLSSCEAAMQWLSDKEEAAAESLPKFNIPDRVVTNADHTISMTIPGRQYAEDTTLPASVEPLLGGITWNQNDPYNRLCPEVVINNDGQEEIIKCVTGCVATATAQVMKYYEWPERGTGSYQYTSQGAAPVELEADFSQSVYDWDNMLDDYSADYTDEQANAVAKLMSDVGIAVNMDYGQTSGAASEMTSYALATYFGYNKGIQLCDRLFYTHAEWNDLLKKELAQSRPINMGGHNYYDNVGHQFVIDGYDEDGNYHVNWGWGGRSNGYFDINYMDPGNQGIGGSNAGYPGIQQINVNCFPDKDGTSVAHYQIVAHGEPTLSEDGMLQCKIANFGLAPYQGQFGFVAMIDNEIIGSAMEDIDELSYFDVIILEIPIDDLIADPEMIVDGKELIIYPVYLDGEDLKVPLSKVAFQDYIMLSLDADGSVQIKYPAEENANPICESMEITRDYAGYNIKGKAVITNEEGRPDFDRPVYMLVIDENSEIIALGQNFAFVGAGESHELEFRCLLQEGKELKIGQTYQVGIIYFVGSDNRLVVVSETTVTIKDPGAAPNLSYSGFALDKTEIAPYEEITISFDVDNTGGFGVESYHVFLFKEDFGMSLDRLSLIEADLPTGTTTVSCTSKVNFGEGNYLIDIYIQSADGEWYRTSEEPLAFTIKDPSSAISSVTANNDLTVRCYDLLGRCVANPTKGLYVKNGKIIAK